jgi:intraflagellar transport protein 122
MQALLELDTGGRFAPVKVDEQMLLGLRKGDVFVCRWPGPAPCTWWRNMVPEIPIAQCGACNHFFHQEEWEFAVLSKGACPFCRAPQQDE